MLPDRYGLVDCHIHLCLLTVDPTSSLRVTCTANRSNGDKMTLPVGLIATMHPAGVAKYADIFRLHGFGSDVSIRR
jgi:hypothetical protein